MVIELAKLFHLSRSWQLPDVKSSDMRDVRARVCEKYYVIRTPTALAAPDIQMSDRGQKAGWGEKEMD